MADHWPDLALLAVLVKVDDLGSIGAAARATGMAQPNASRAIKTLEQQFGTPLLERHPRGSTLTPQGRVIAHWAREILVASRRLLDAAETLRAQRHAEVTVGASMTVAEHLVPEWLGEFRRRHTDLQIHLQVHNSTEIFARVAAGSCDVGFVEAPQVPRGLHKVTVAHDELVVVVHPAHKWARRRSALTVAELAATPLIVREPGSGSRITLDRALRGCSRAAPLLELGSSAAVRTSALAGVGPAVLSTLAVADLVSAGDLRIVHIEGVGMRRVLRAVWRAPARLDGPAGELVGIARRSH